MKSILNSYYEYMNKAKEERGVEMRSLLKKVFSIFTKKNTAGEFKYCCVASQGIF